MMITRKELEKMIENGETVWVLLLSGKKSIALNDSVKITETAGLDWLHIKYAESYPLSWLYRSEEELDWHLNMHATREERFEPPTWEEVKDNIGWCFSFLSKDGKYDLYILYPDKNNPEKHIFLYYPYGEGYDKGLATKENYAKAVEIARKLFLGESDG